MSGGSGLAYTRSCHDAATQSLLPDFVGEVKSWYPAHPTHIDMAYATIYLMASASSLTEASILTCFLHVALHVSHAQHEQNISDQGFSSPCLLLHSVAARGWQCMACYIGIWKNWFEDHLEVCNAMQCNECTT